MVTAYPIIAAGRVTGIQVPVVQTWAIIQAIRGTAPTIRSAIMLPPDIAPLLICSSQTADHSGSQEWDIATLYLMATISRYLSA